MIDDGLDDFLLEELKALFDVDTQMYLQNYRRLCEQLNATSWKADIQEIYRAVHTIKGGAVTVGADGILYVAAALEDLLSDLRYLEVTPNLSDGHLREILLEAGELLAFPGLLDLHGDQAKLEVIPTVERLGVLREEVQRCFLPEWDEQKALFAEFASQGFDLVVLDLEMGLEGLGDEHGVSPELVNTALNTLGQLRTIGKGLGFEKGWFELLGLGEGLLGVLDGKVWQCDWPVLFRELKACAREGGKGDLSALTLLCTTQGVSLDEVNKDLARFDESVGDKLELQKSGDADFLAEDLSIVLPEIENEELVVSIDEGVGDLGDLIDEDNFLAGDLSVVLPEIENEELVVSIDEGVGDLGDLIDEDNFLAGDLSVVLPEMEEDFSPMNFVNLEVEEVEGEEFVDDVNTLDLAALDEAMGIFEDLPLDLSGLDEADNKENDNEVIGVPDHKSAAYSADTKKISIEPAHQDASRVPVMGVGQGRFVTPSDLKVEESGVSVQIPVPLSRANRLSADLVEVVLGSRSCGGLYKRLQELLSRLFALSQEGVLYLTKLREIQDDYASTSDFLMLLPTEGRTEKGERRKGENSLPHSPTPHSPLPNARMERYREGYSTINRLLEIGLRSSELSGEASKIGSALSEGFLELERDLTGLEGSVSLSRVVAFSMLGYKARAVVRDLSNRYGKPVDFVIEGSEIELDAALSTRLEPALLHLLRNAYDHGLEDSDERVRLGKPAKGKIFVRLKRHVNRYVLEVGDDGRGIDAVSVAAVARAKGLRLVDTSTNEGLLSVLIQPGFSTSREVSEISGRGVGMDVVATQVMGLGGQLSLETYLGRGTVVRLGFSTPRLLVPCVLLRRGGFGFAIPMDCLYRAALWDADQVNECDGDFYGWEVESYGQRHKMMDLMMYWKGERRGGVLLDTAVRVLVGSHQSGNRLWLLADELGEVQEFLITSLPSPYVSPVGLVGVGVLLDGGLVPVIDGAALADGLFDYIHSVSELPTQSTSRMILVVDDAALMRRRIEASLTREGFSVWCCSDGLEAISWLGSHDQPALMITDLEMPNMDGFTLIQRLREQGITMPILVISSRLSSEWNKEAQRLGASGFLTKGFSTGELLATVREFVSEQ